MSSLHIVNEPVNRLKANPSNARTHNETQLQQIAKSIEKFGFNNPVLIDADRMIIAGHGRVAAAKILGLEAVPTVRLDHLSEAQKRAYVIADNRLAELAGWDREILAIELQYLVDEELEFEITDVGFSAAEIDVLLTEDSETVADPDIREFCLGPAVSKPGDLWLIGPHRLLCGNALELSSYERLMAGKRAEMAFTDPPYNVPIAGHVSGLGRARHDEFVMVSGEMSEGEFTRFLSTAFRHMAAWTIDGSIHFVCMDWRHLLELLRAGRIAYSELKNICVWAKANGGMGSLYRSQHELVGVFKNGTARHINNVELGQNGRYRTNVWNYAGMNSFQADRDEMLAMHPTVKPTAMIADAMLDCSRRQGIVLDPFMGSGSTIIAAARVGRQAYGLELDPNYVDVALRRVRATIGIDAVQADSGRSFSELEAANSDTLQAAE